MQFNVKWADLKAFAISRQLSIQWIIAKNMYRLAAIDGPIEMKAQILISANPAPGSDQEDFETNFKSSGNRSPSGNMVQVLGKDNLALCPFGSYHTMKPNDVTVWDIPLPTSFVLRGGVIFSPNSTLGDWVSIQVIDKDNVVGLGGTPENPTILGAYVLSWYVMPNTPNKLEDISISQSLPQGVYMRINYTSVGAIPAQVLINFISYVGF